MGHLVDGEWRSGFWKYTNNKSDDGSFKREASVVRDWVRADGSTEFKPEAGRYHLYLAHACPWANRTWIMRNLKGLKDAISVSFVDPFMAEDGWVFTDAHADTLYGHAFLRDVYTHGDAKYSGRVTVPVLWDKKLERIVNNESREIIRMLDHEFGPVASKSTDYAPAGLLSQIEETITAIYEPINNGVYRSGFARSQEAYDSAVSDVFSALDHWESVLAAQRYLCGAQITEADICMFTTLVRFDAVYHTHFKCNLKRIRDYEHLSGYVRDLYQTEEFRETVHMAEIKEHYFRSHDTINPYRIVPVGPELDLEAPHSRAAI